MEGVWPHTCPIRRFFFPIGVGRVVKVYGRGAKPRVLPDLGALSCTREQWL